ncbi:mannose-6-phosphate isomerase [Candidatus Izimaplasma bacterium ZiA1]|uniref:class I mannose-6-phosphate isomerase n=1 Tax=Candidatus Izimoplasma sp. ZiA1 TaxID=2024899 RepID=UPI000BAA60C4|nr:mannose-6-phosphate isomerase [Candidatus Izimaplasma bacterium ZiA1]
MNYINFKSQYDLSPKIHISGENKIIKGYKNIHNYIKKDTSKHVFVFECYPGVRYEEIEQELFSLFNNSTIINVDNYAKSNDEINLMFSEYLTDDRVFGYMNDLDVLDLYSKENQLKILDLVNQSTNNVIVYGFGASQLVKADTLAIFDMARWEIQKRLRSHEMSNWRQNDYDLDILRKYKRGFFIEWRIADKIKDKLYNEIDYYIDTNKYNDPKMITGDEFTNALKHASTKPFRLVPYFDTGVWGGQWMKEVCNLDKNAVNYAWCFDGVPEENSIYLEFGDDYIESPSINLVLYQPHNLLGEKIVDKYGKEFPIRFDFLDTVEGGNLSLQVHPLESYIKDKFNMKYTQDESYYILYAKEDAKVFLGLKDNIDKDELLKDLENANKGLYPFPNELYINEFKAKKHDHFLIPAGTIHCSGSNAMVLEISATPYIFTFKLWDWGRLGLDGIPRPVHINHGKEVIQYDRTTKWVEDNLVNHFEKLYEDENTLIEKTGLHALEPIETIRHCSDLPVMHEANKSVHVMNLVDGEEAIIKSPSNDFEPFVIHYAETVIIPASINEYTVSPHGPSKGKKVTTLKAYIK